MDITLHPLFFVVIGFILFIYPLSLVARSRQWEIKQMKAGKSRAIGYIILFPAICGALLGILSFTAGMDAMFPRQHMSNDQVKIERLQEDLLRVCLRDMTQHNHK